MDQDITAQATGWGTIPQAAEHYQVSTKTVRRYITAGLLEARRVGPRLIRVRLSSVESLGSTLGKAGHRNATD